MPPGWWRRVAGLDARRSSAGHRDHLLAGTTCGAEKLRRPDRIRALEAEGFDFVAQPLIRELVVIAAPAAFDDVVTIAGFSPGNGHAHALADLVEVPGALDGIRHRGEEDLRVGGLDVLDRGRDVLEFLAL